MATITEDYVSFETAKLLKGKGFDNISSIMYKENGEKCINPKSVVSWRLKYWYPCVTHQMVMKWLREVHKISIEITSTGYLIDNDVAWECDIKAGHRLYFKHITNEKSFESCAEAAIKYCLKNLI